MLGNNFFRKTITSFTAVAIFCVYSMVALAIPTDVTGEITVTGQVSVNGQTAVSNTTILSGSTVVTGAGSNAVVSLGKTGRVEVMENSNLVLNFSAAGIIAVLSSGKARVANASGVATTLTTSHATIIADASQANSFTAEIECGHTHIDTASGSVTVREGSNDRQVAAGTSATAGNLHQTGCQPCLRPDSAPKVAIAPWPWILLLGAGAAGAAILIGKKDRPDFGGGTIVVSPNR